MAMVCPRCNGCFEQRWTCPACNVRLSFQAARSRGGAARAADSAGPWQQTPWGRIFFGVVLAQGLYYGLRQLCTAGLLAGGDDPSAGVWSTLLGLLLLQGIQALGLLVAGVFSGAGQRQGIVFGAVVGVWNGVLSVAVQSAVANHTAVTLLGQPILHTAFGAFGGFLGSCIWRPLPLIALPGTAKPSSPLTPVATKPRTSLFSGSIAWGRVLAGAALAVGGTLWANVILELVLDASDGKLTVDNHLQARLVTWEVTAVATLAGAAVAGACTFNSIKQGLCVGVTAAAVLLGLRLGAPGLALHDVVLTGATALCLGVAGAWFGGSLFPPLAPKPKGKKIAEAA